MYVGSQGLYVGAGTSGGMYVGAGTSGGMTVKASRVTEAMYLLGLTQAI